MRWDRTKLAVAVGGIVILIVVLALALVRVGPVLSQPLAIGYVDMQRALDAHPQKASSEKALQEFFQAKQREFQAKAKNLTPAQRQELDRQLQQQILQRRQELLSGLDRDIRQAIAQAARARNITIVLDRSVVLYGGVDLTEDVIRILQKGR
ncbi:MAG: OmpH family outer membrane protein [Armatimonadota bacterium]|nr:OmpH family outer membrane protein [Armatimonadota bacterium]MDR5702750.1 OmpH family outer membrane protein [Armatimonadota bacterium]MDR7435180.1 OmpH family outer membrane protein [Armatimonadota bacterium]